MMRMGRIRARAEPLVLLRRLRARARDAPARTTLTARWSLAEIAARRPEALHRLDLLCIEGHVYVHVRFTGNFSDAKTILMQMETRESATAAPWHRCAKLLVGAGASCRCFSQLRDLLCGGGAHLTQKVGRRGRQLGRRCCSSARASGRKPLLCVRRQRAPLLLGLADGFLERLDAIQFGIAKLWRTRATVPAIHARHGEEAPYRRERGEQLQARRRQTCGKHSILSAMSCRLK